MANGLFEDVSDLNGIAIPCIYYEQIYFNHFGKKPENVLYSFIQNSILQMKENEHILLKKIFKSISPICNTFDDYLYISNIYVAFQEKLYFKIKQIEKNEHNWLTNEMIEKCRQRIEFCIKEQNNNSLPSLPVIENIHHFEYAFIQNEDENHVYIDKLIEQIKIQNPKELLSLFKGKFRFSARVDIVTINTVWEFKFVKQITEEYLLQLVIYSWLWKCVFINDPLQYKKIFKILNIKTGEIYTLNSSFEELTQIVILLLKSRFEKTPIVTNDDFINNISL